MINSDNKQIDQEKKQRKQGRAVLQNLKELKVGAGATLFGIDVRGLWLGAKDWASAPFRVDMEGNVVGVSLSGTEFSGLTITSSTITGGTVATASSGLRMRMNGSTNSYEFLNSDVVLVELKSVSVPFSGSSGASFRHGTGRVMVEVSGQGEGLGTRQALFTNSTASVAFGILDTDDGNYYIIADGLPTSASGLPTGAIWSDGGTLKIAS